MHLQYIVSADGQVHIVVAVCYKVKKHYITLVGRSCASWGTHSPLC